MANDAERDGRMSADDAPSVDELLKQSRWDKRLEAARAQRARVLAEKRARGELPKSPVLQNKPWEADAEPEPAPRPLTAEARRRAEIARRPTQDADPHRPADTSRDAPAHVPPFARPVPDRSTDPAPTALSQDRAEWDAQRTVPADEEQARPAAVAPPEMPAPAADKPAPTPSSDARTPPLPLTARDRRAQPAHAPARAPGSPEPVSRPMPPDPRPAAPVVAAARAPARKGPGGLSLVAGFVLGAAVAGSALFYFWPEAPSGSDPADIATLAPGQGATPSAPPAQEVSPPAPSPRVEAAPQADTAAIEPPPATPAEAAPEAPASEVALAPPVDIPAASAPAVLPERTDAAVASPVIAPLPEAPGEDAARVPAVSPAPSPDLPQPDVFAAGPGLGPLTAPLPDPRPDAAGALASDLVLAGRAAPARLDMPDDVLLSTGVRATVRAPQLPGAAPQAAPAADVRLPVVAAALPVPRPGPGASAGWRGASLATPGNPGGPGPGGRGPGGRGRAGRRRPDAGAGVRCRRDLGRGSVAHSGRRDPGACRSARRSACSARPDHGGPARARSDPRTRARTSCGAGRRRCAGQPPDSRPASARPGAPVLRRDHLARLQPEGSRPGQRDHPADPDPLLSRGRRRRRRADRRTGRRPRARFHQLPAAAAAGHRGGLGRGRGRTGPAAGAPGPGTATAGRAALRRRSPQASAIAAIPESRGRFGCRSWMGAVPGPEAGRSVGSACRATASAARRQTQQQQNSDRRADSGA